MFCPTINKVVVVFARTDGRGRACIIIPNASTDTVTFGTEVTVSTDLTFDFVSMDYDVVNNIVGFSYENLNNDGYFNCLTPNADNTITVGSQIEPEVGTISFTQCTYDPIGDRFIMVYLDAPLYFYYFVHVDSNRVMTELNTFNFPEADVTQGQFRSIYDPTTATVYNFDSRGQVFLSTFGTDDITAYNSLTSSLLWSISAVYCTPTLISNGRVFLAIRDISTTPFSGKSFVVGDLINTPIGLAAESISNGAAGKVTVAGGINTHQSGLAGGTPYRAALQGAARLVTIADSLPFVSSNTTLPVHAIAQSATTVYVTGFTPLISIYFRRS